MSLNFNLNFQAICFNFIYLFFLSYSVGFVDLLFLSGVIVFSAYCSLHIFLKYLLRKQTNKYLKDTVDSYLFCKVAALSLIQGSQDIYVNHNTYRAATFDL